MLTHVHYRFHLPAAPQCVNTSWSAKHMSSFGFFSSLAFSSSSLLSSNFLSLFNRFSSFFSFFRRSFSCGQEEALLPLLRTVVLRITAGGTHKVRPRLRHFWWHSVAEHKSADAQKQDAVQISYPPPPSYGSPRPSWASCAACVSLSPGRAQTLFILHSQFIWFFGVGKQLIYATHTINTEYMHSRQTRITIRHTINMLHIASQVKCKKTKKHWAGKETHEIKSYIAGSYAHTHTTHKLETAIINRACQQEGKLKDTGQEV